MSCIYLELFKSYQRMEINTNTKDSKTCETVKVEEQKKIETESKKKHKLA